MKNATFYLLDNNTPVDGLSAVEALVCELAAERWRDGKRILVACEDEQQAIRLDEALWQRDSHHSLCPITWRAKAPGSARRWNWPGLSVAAALRATF